MKKKKENENNSRVYLKSWELKFPWITKGEGPNGEGQFYRFLRLDLSSLKSTIFKRVETSKGFDIVHFFK